MKKIYVIPEIKTREVSTFGLLQSSKGDTTGVQVIDNGSSFSSEVTGDGGKSDGTIRAESKGNSFGEWEDDEVVEK